MKKLFAWNIALLLVLTAAFFMYGYNQSLFFRPNSYHQWRQSDCLSIAKNYYEEGMKFFSPRIHYQGVPEGRAVSELPLLNYLGALLWKIFGEHEFIYRLMNYTFLVAALFFLFRTVFVAVNRLGAGTAMSGILALIVASIPLTSPLLAYYGPNFMSDVPALALQILTFCALYQLYLHGSQRLIYVAIGCSVLAVFIKASAYFGFIMVTITALASLPGVAARFQPGIRIRRPWIALSILFVSGCLIIAWYRFALAYNNNEENFVFLLTILPVWEMELPEVLAIFYVLVRDFFPLFLNIPMLGITTLCLLYVIIRFRALNSCLQWTLLVSGGYFVCNIILFYRVFDVHEYYLINNFIFPVIIWFCTSYLLAGKMPSKTRIVSVTCAAVLLIVFNIYSCGVTQRLRTIPKDEIAHNSPLVNSEEKGMADFLFWRYSLSIGKIEHFTPTLRAAGISRNDMVLSIPDPSFNISLYLMDQKGFTVSPDHITTDSLVMDQFMHRVSYVILSDTTLKHQPAFRRNDHRMQLYLTEGSVQVYKIKTG